MQQKRGVIFYSWQSDDRDTKKFIKKCLRKAIGFISSDPILDFRPTLDDSTKGKMGAVEIPATIMKKIDECDVFVADLSYVGEYDNRKIVNQNVLYELGYMIGKKTADKVIMLFNNDLGEIKDLPFDISHRRVTPFSIKNDKAGEQLTSILATIIRSYLQNTDLQEKLPKTKMVELDAEELSIMKFFSTIANDKRIHVTKTMGEPIIQSADRCDSNLLNSLIKKYGANRLVANLNDLAEKGVLKLFYSKKGTPNYELTKLGYNIIEDQQKNSWKV